MFTCVTFIIVMVICSFMCLGKPVLIPIHVLMFCHTNLMSKLKNSFNFTFIFSLGLETLM